MVLVGEHIIGAHLQYVSKLLLDRVTARILTKIIRIILQLTRGKKMSHIKRHFNLTTEAMFGTMFLHNPVGNTSLNYSHLLQYFYNILKESTLLTPFILSPSHRSPFSGF